MSTSQHRRYTIGFDEVDHTDVALVGGKGANLGALSRLEGVRVPDGFCVTTHAFARVIADSATLGALLDRLSLQTADDRDGIGALSAEIRQRIGATDMPEEVVSQIREALAGLGDQRAYAVRSSATAEDLPTASFAGQHDSYLNIIGLPAVLTHVRRCWASLFTDRAVTYRLRHHIDHRQVQMAVVVQQMIDPDASGVMFTADPITSHRRITAIEATFGLGEALVSGRVNTDSYRVRDNAIVDKTIAVKQLAVSSTPPGRTQETGIDPGRQTEPALTDLQVLALAKLGRRIEAHFGAPQDIEWCLTEGDVQIVQSRPITTLFPIPAAQDTDHHVYISVGHGQMMTDPMKPLGLSMWQLTTPAPMAVAAGRLFVDVTQRLANPATRAGLLNMVGRSDPLVGDALTTLVERGALPPPPPIGAPTRPHLTDSLPELIEADGALVAELIEKSQASIATLKREIQRKTGDALFAFILDDLKVLRGLLFEPRSIQVIMAAVQATWWLKDHLAEWLGDSDAADTLTLSAPNNVSSEMGLALLDVADAIRPYPDVIAFLEHVNGDDGFLGALDSIEGGRAARAAIEAYLDPYGMRCVGEIDITRPRWAERPSTLVPAILSDIRNFEPGAGARRFELGRQRAADAERDVLARLRALPDGDRKADETKRMIDRVRTFVGYREYPKYSWVSRYLLYKRALLREAEGLVRAGVLRRPEDAFYLSFQELREAVRAQSVDLALLDAHERAHAAYQALTPPRVITSDGEVVTGAYRREALPPGALPGLAVSSGIIEGRARVITQMADADLEPGDILVTIHTDPSWSPMFVAAAGLVTEVGGLMTHGAVVAREYGLPAVVGVEGATRHIQDGQRIRVDGTRGYVEILPGL